MRRNDARLLTLQINATITSFSQFTKSGCNWELTSKSNFKGANCVKRCQEEPFWKGIMLCGGGWHYPYPKLLGFSTEIPPSSFSIVWNNNDSNLNMTLWWFSGMSVGRHLSHPQNFVLGYVNSKIYLWLFAFRLCYCQRFFFFHCKRYFPRRFPSYGERSDTKNHKKIIFAFDLRIK